MADELEKGTEVFDVWFDSSFSWTTLTDQEESEE
jgi:isoleucyl-tRNA synthetase